MKTKDIKKGISLIVLIITIIVVIILAAVVILTLSKNNPIESAKEARFKEDVRTFQDELAMTVSKEYTSAGGHRDTKITTSDFNEIQGYIPSFSEKYKGKFVIQDDELRYTKQLDDIEKEYAQSLNVKEKQKLLPAEYQQVEYIESTGTQYIDTRVLGGTNASYEIWLNSLSYVNCTYEQYFAGDKASTIPKLFHHPNGMMKAEIKANGGVGLINIGDIICKIEFNNNGVLNVDGVKKYQFTSFENGWGSLSWYVFSSHGENNLKSIMRLYKLKMYSDEVLIKDFIPCYSTITVTNVDGEICNEGTAGLYDLVEGKFYTNKGDKTKGDFVCGPEVR